MMPNDYLMTWQPNIQVKCTTSKYYHYCVIW